MNHLSNITIHVGTISLPSARYNISGNINIVGGLHFCGKTIGREDGLYVGKLVCLFLVLSIIDFNKETSV